ncbi:chloramphenicol phosphotransferase CPT family protein [Shinella curvata]|uniref:Chloramphenicol phosphotransferase CPT family protein n=1 Tax=Shinella curvata TaxID=1817964 RepID=A0ABT8XFK4_9HYPH|nr:chloramphenicol phosphotransferase CPT family protein [Shinella curvata]MCJ8053189.1 chloramphenicol phosphotransferase CPT family protein [Shinella curvata]MDO6122520.1 chloramphenicol phosphotransferase CPT family protein [Shinella curvata]
MEAGRIILLNGTSSSGKSTLARVLRTALPEPFCYYASDQLADAGFRTIKRDARRHGLERARFFDGFHRSILSFAEAGNDLLVEHIVEEESWARSLQQLLAPLDVFWIGVHAPMAELERRELQRGDRSPGEAVFHLKTHDYCTYDLTVDTSEPEDVVVEKIVTAWRGRTRRAFKA